MARKLVEELLVPREHGGALTVKRGQVLRIIMVEGKQVGDLAIWNAHDYKETYDACLTYAMNRVEGTGDYRHVKKLYAKLPKANLMFTVIEDRVGAHWCLSGNKCSVPLYKLREKHATVESQPVPRGYHRNCQDNIAEAIISYGLTPEDVPNVFNVFMNVTLDENGGHFIRPPLGNKGDYIDLLAEMDCLVALSACPAPWCNDGINKPLKMEVWE
ncbi:MAG: urea carboxylase-associated family protein [Chloroflexi bacterium]|nr:urea carboxylase-associated family protein [Chloroflexota bacterium]